MRRSNTAERLRQLMIERNLKQIDIVNLAQPFCKQYDVKLGRNDISQYLAGKVEPGQHKLYILGKALNVSEAWLMGFDVPMERNDGTNNRFPAPNITEDFTTFPVIGEIAAGYNHIAIENWEGDTVDIPNTYLHGRSHDEFIVLCVKGDSMYPIYQDGDKVLILKQSTLNNSGDIGAILYDDEISTIKKVEYEAGKDRLRLVPLNPLFKPETISGERLEHCRVIGIPKLVIREIS